MKVLFGYFMESHLLGLFQKASRRTWGLRNPLWGAPMRGGRPHEGLLHGAPLASLLPFYALVEVSIHGHFWVFGMASLPLGFPINRGGEVLSTLIPFSHTCHARLALSLSLPRKDFRRAERLSGFRWELVLDSEALPDR